MWYSVALILLFATAAFADTKNPEEGENVEGDMVLTAELKPKHGSCPSFEWRYYAGYCYYFSPRRSKWKSARNFCIRQRATLLCVSNKSEWSWVKGVVKSKGIRNWWIGVNDRRREKRVRCDGRPLTYTKWSRIKWNTRRRDCVRITAFTRRWRFKRCRRRYRFICKRKLDE
uniref:Toxin candidate TRINITY_DN19182_c0_g1_i1.p1 n=1 Tax=Isarachnanthus nocturnus TaxID=1240238 RepID=A0A7G7WYX2_9CNID|nr:toxin candidate TRINITY_DN19182_c0_g1_i1.p1 [Isarachnanthus nocturnus]